MISVVIPCYNEKDSLSALLPELQAALPEAEVMVVQDGPDDGTEALCYSLRIRHVRGRNEGLGQAIALGIVAASNNNVIVMDGDGQHPVSAVVDIAWELECGTSLVFGVRHEKNGMSFVRGLMSDTCGFITMPLCRMRDPMTGLFGLDRRIVYNKNLNPDTWKIGLEIGSRTGVQGVSVPYQFQYRIAGKSKASIKPALQFISQLARLYVWKLDFTQMMRFCLVGTSGLVVNFGLMTALVEWMGVDYRPAAIVGIGAAMLWNYVWNKFWTFKREAGHAKQASGERAASGRQREAKA